jgi:hypothetical protein
MVKELAAVVWRDSWHSPEAYFAEGEFEAQPDYIVESYGRVAYDNKRGIGLVGSKHPGNRDKNVEHIPRQAILAVVKRRFLVPKAGKR